MSRYAATDVVALYGGPHDGAKARPARPGAAVIVVRGTTYRRTIATDRDGRPIYAVEPPAPA